MPRPVSLFRIHPLPGGWDPASRLEKEHQIIALVEGGGSLLMDGLPRAVQGPMVVLVSKGKRQSFLPGEEARGWILSFQDTLFPMNLRLLYARLFQASTVSLAVPSFRRRVISLIQCIEDIHCLGFREEQRAIPYLLYGLLQLLLLPGVPLAVPGEATTTSHFALFVRFLQLVDQYGLDVTSVNFYTERLQVSPHRLREACRAQAGKSPQAVLEELRMTEAKRLLADSDAPIKQIATVLGYQDPAYFTRAFRRATGQSPRGFRGDKGR